MQLSYTMTLTFHFLSTNATLVCFFVLAPYIKSGVLGLIESVYRLIFLSVWLQISRRRWHRSAWNFAQFTRYSTRKTVNYLSEQNIRRVELSCVAIDTLTDATQLNSTSSWVELCRYKLAFTTRRRSLTERKCCPNAVITSNLIFADPCLSISVRRPYVVPLMVTSR